MNTAIGVRCTPSEVTYAIVREDENEVDIALIDKLVLPKALSIPERLKFLRNTFLDIIDENKISKACIRVTESQAQTTNLERIMIEAVIQELIASSSIKKYFVGQISNITSKLKIERQEFKHFANGTKNFPGIGNWSTFKDLEKESIMAALSALKL